MQYVKRDLEDKILAVSREYACILITGPRQVGKATMPKRLGGDDRKYVLLDDLEECWPCSSQYAPMDYCLSCWDSLKNIVSMPNQAA